MIGFILVAMIILGIGLIGGPIAAGWTLIFIALFLFVFMVAKS